ncbi:MAG: protein-methionine-sulfoxide reductase heme-binding subunit MsrQ [Beijerinckiaceae bacterium]|jgi:sulfoxide reductase heme-binding subunit YedZ
MTPWSDRTGRFAPLRAFFFAALFLPALWLALAAARNGLGSRPTAEAIHQAGLWAIRLLALSLAMTPLRVASRYAKLAGIRRMLGLSVLAYAALHLGLYIYSQHFDMAKVASEIVKRIYLLIGFAGFLGLLTLGVTSSDAMVRRLGAPLWNKLHRIVYVIAVLAVVHFFMQSKLDETEAFIMAGLFGLLLFARVGKRVQGDLTLAGAVASAAGATVLTGLAEAGWYSFKTGAPFDLVLGANFDPSLGIRPAWCALGFGVVLVLARASRPLFQQRPGVAGTQGIAKKVRDRLLAPLQG